VRRSIRGEKRVKGAGEFEFDSRTYHVRYILTETDDGGIEGIIVLRDDKGLDWNNLLGRTQDFFHLRLSDGAVCRIRPRSYTPVNRTIRVIGRRK
jgi:hypothetical protein